MSDLLSFHYVFSGTFVGGVVFFFLLCVYAIWLCGYTPLVLCTAVDVNNHVIYLHIAIGGPTHCPHTGVSVNK